MSRVAPTSGTKVLYFFLIIISGFLIYIDLNQKSFEGTKNFYQSFIISSSYIFKSATVEPIKFLYQISKDKSELINENKKLKLELDNSYISNFIISRDSKFFPEDNSLKKFLKDPTAVKHFPALGEATLSGLMVVADNDTGLANKVEPIVFGGPLENKI